MKINKLLVITSLAIAGCSSSSNHSNFTKREVKPNEFWWPNKVNLSPLRQHAAESSPYGNYRSKSDMISPTNSLIDRAYMLDLTVPEMTALVGGMRVNCRKC